MASTSAILLWGEAVADLDELSIDNFVGLLGDYYDRRRGSDDSR